MSRRSCGLPAALHADCALPQQAGGEQVAPPMRRERLQPEIPTFKGGQASSRGRRRVVAAAFAGAAWKGCTARILDRSFGGGQSDQAWRPHGAPSSRPPTAGHRQAAGSRPGSAADGTGPSLRGYMVEAGAWRSPKDPDGPLGMAGTGQGSSWKNATFRAWSSLLRPFLPATHCFPFAEVVGMEAGSSTRYQQAGRGLRWAASGGNLST